MIRDLYACRFRRYIERLVAAHPNKTTRAHEESDYVSQVKHRHGNPVASLKRILCNAYNSAAKRQNTENLALQTYENNE